MPHCATCEAFLPPRHGDGAYYCDDACRILDKVLITESNCAEWQNFRAPPEGYGRITLRGGDITKAHRRAYEVFVGPIPVGKKVLHHCDNPPCVNPDHLFLGTDADNARDSMLKGRKARKVPAEVLVASLAEIEAGEATQAEIARRLGIDSSTVSKWRSRRRALASEEGMTYRAA